MYCGNNAVILVDSSGMITEILGPVIVAAAGAGLATYRVTGNFWLSLGAAVFTAGGTTYYYLTDTEKKATECAKKIAEAQPPEPGERLPEDAVQELYGQ